MGPHPLFRVSGNYLFSFSGVFLNNGFHVLLLVPARKQGYRFGYYEFELEVVVYTPGHQDQYRYSGFQMQEGGGGMSSGGMPEEINRNAFKGTGVLVC